MNIEDYNDAEIDPKYLGKLTTNFIKIADNLKETAYQIKKRGFSSYPVFPICKIKQPIGQVLFAMRDLPELEWDYYASFLEEFQQREILDDEGTERFKAAYKNPEEFCCLFVIDEQFTRFVFVPYPEED
ncbi:MAG: hypothetical protein COZ18_15170 [Flexibacter sp. CG_4_10_14_3_um_filter_32_15]|nr:MAG: hypothetical protein COZ18_15170 [Flexibacter sp. CG_4_10_14_3_um_filter_32_15]PJB17201.1 MAG: hypothetical protein CO117_12550 [Flavobacteriaceae bacterium CG_4_9_14_3_um_filter_33_16]